VATASITASHVAIGLPHVLHSCLLKARAAQTTAAMLIPLEKSRKIGEGRFLGQKKHTDSPLAGAAASVKTSAKLLAARAQFLASAVAFSTT